MAELTQYALYRLAHRVAPAYANLPFLQDSKAFWLGVQYYAGLESVKNSYIAEQIFRARDAQGHPIRKRPSIFMPRSVPNDRAPRLRPNLQPQSPRPAKPAPLAHKELELELIRQFVMQFMLKLAELGITLTETHRALLNRVLNLSPQALLSNDPALKRKFIQNLENELNQQLKAKQRPILAPTAFNQRLDAYQHALQHHRGIKHAINENPTLEPVVEKVVIAVAAISLALSQGPERPDLTISPMLDLMHQEMTNHNNTFKELVNSLENMATQAKTSTPKPRPGTKARRVN